jgi:hypothetical protein
MPKKNGIKNDFECTLFFHQKIHETEKPKNNACQQESRKRWQRLCPFPGGQCICLKG